MSNLTSNDHDVIWEILENFDFARVHSVMTHLEWTWTQDNPRIPFDQVPTVDKLRAAARQQLKHAIEGTRSESNGAQFFSGSGGFEAEAFIDEEGTVRASLKFVVADWDNFE